MFFEEESSRAQLVLCVVGGVNIGIPIGAVDEVCSISIDDLVGVPGTRAFVRGAFVKNDSSYYVYDISSMLFNKPVVPLDSTLFCIVFKKDSFLEKALLVDCVCGSISYRDTAVRPPKKGAPASAFARGLIHEGERDIVILDPEKFLKNYIK